MKTTNENNKLEKQLNFLKNFLDINVRHFSRQFLIVEKYLLTHNHFLTNKKPKMINAKYGLCYKFDFDNKTLFVSKAKAICLNDNDFLPNGIINTKNENGQKLAIEANDLIFAKDFKFDILIKKNGEKDLFETQEAINKIYNEPLKS